MARGALISKGLVVVSEASVFAVATRGSSGPFVSIAAKSIHAVVNAFSGAAAMAASTDDRPLRTMNSLPTGAPVTENGLA